MSTTITLPPTAALVDALGVLGMWAHQCHAASLHLVKSGVFGDTPVRVARGTANGVPGQHSWVVVGSDCYEPFHIIDPTLWSYREDVNGIYVWSLGAYPHSRSRYRHTPHGAGSIWAWGRPGSHGGEPVALTPTEPLSRTAQAFLDMIGPLDMRGWSTLLSRAPVGGWPAGEVIAAADDTPALAALVPVDRLGMLTDRNPNGLYLP